MHNAARILFHPTFFYLHELLYPSEELGFRRKKTIQKVYLSILTFISNQIKNIYSQYHYTGYFDNCGRIGLRPPTRVGVREMIK